MQRHNVTVIDFGKSKPPKKRPWGKIILFSLLGLIVAAIAAVIAVFSLLPSLTSDEINQYVAPPSGSLAFSDVLGQIPLEDVEWEEGSLLQEELPDATLTGVGLWGYNSLLRAGDRVMELGEAVSHTSSPLLDNPQVWSRLELVAYKEKVYLIKYFPSFYNRDNVSCYEVVDGWEMLDVIESLE